VSNGISSLLKKFNTAIGETKAQMDLLSEEADRRRQQSQTPFLNTPQIFTAEEVAGLGLVTETGEPFNIDEGWQLKVTQTGAEPSISLINPEGWELLEDQTWVSPEGERLTSEQYLEQFPQTLPTVYTPEGEVSEWQLLPAEKAQLLNETLAELNTFTDEDWESWFEQLQAEGKTQDSVMMLSVLGATMEEIDAFFEQVEITPASMTPKTREERTLLLQSSYGKWAEFSPEALDEFFTLSPGIGFGVQKTSDIQLRDDVINWAWSNIRVKSGETIEEAYDDRIGAWIEGGWTEAEAKKYAVADAVGVDVDYLIKLQTGIFPPPSLGEQALASFKMGISDVVSSVAGAAGWLGMEDVAADVADARATMDLRFLAEMPLSIHKDFEWSDLLDVGFYATKVTRAMPFALSLIPLAVGGFTLGAAGATALGLGRLGTWLVGTFAGTALSRPAESLMEAGEAWNYAIATGLTPEEADEAARSVFTQNLSLAGLDAVEIGIAFAPTPSWVPLRLVELGLVRTMRIAGKVIIVGLSEGGEEIYQDIIQRRARGEEWHWDAMSKEVFAIGAIMGMGMGLGGDILTSFTERVETNLPPPQRQKYDDRVDELKKEGTPEDAAKLQAIEELAATDAVVNETVKQAISQEQAIQEGDNIWHMEQELSELQELIKIDVNALTSQKTELENSLSNTRGKTETHLEWARLEAQIEAAEASDATLDSMIQANQIEQGNRSMPYHSRARGAFPQYTTEQLEEQLQVYEAEKRARSRIKYLESQLKTAREVSPAPQTVKRAKINRTAKEGATILESLKALYSDIQAEIKTAQAAIKGLTGNEALAAQANLRQLQRQLNITKRNMDKFQAKPDEELVKNGIPSQELKAENVDRIITKLIILIEQALPARAMTEAMKSAEISKRAGRAGAILEQGGGRQAFYQAKAQLTGKYPTAEFTAPETNMTEEDVEALFDWIETADLPILNRGPLTRIQASEALEVLLSGRIPTEGQLALLESVFGSDLIKTILAKRPFGKKAWEAFLNIINLPKAVLASWDLSAPLRQGALLFWAHPRQSIPALGTMLRGLLTKTNAASIMADIESSKYALLREQAGLYIAPITGVAARVSTREEAFMTSLAEYIPGIQQSERAYIIYLNKLRASIFDKYAALWEGEGKSMKDYRDLADFINLATGRGPLGKLKNMGAFMNAVLFSPRLQTSRLLLPYKVFTFNGATRAVAFRSMAAFIGTTFALMACLKLAFPDDVDIEFDPRSSDFLKIRIGNVRLDPWAGFQQYVRYGSQLVTGYSKSSSTGTVRERNRWDIVMSLIRSKESPVMGLAHDILEGQTFIGDELSLEAENVRQQIFNRLTPLFIQDIVEAFNADGLFGAFAATPGFFGWGVVSYPNPLEVCESQLGETIDESVIDPEKGEAIYDLKKFGQDINNMTKDMTPKEAEEFGHSEMVIAYIKMREQREIYGALEDRAAKDKWLAEHPEANAMLAFWGIAGADFETREAWDIAQKMFKDYDVPEDAIPESNVPADAVDSYFEYMEVVAEHGANSAEARAIRANDPAFEAWGEATRGWQPIEPSTPADEITLKWAEQDTAYDALETREERETYLEANPEYAIARLQRDAVNYGFTENLIPDYVEYYSLPGKEGDFYDAHPNEPLYEDDWYLIEHPEFYQAALEYKGWQPRDFSKVPTRQVWGLYQQWKDLPLGAERREFEAANPMLDYWLHIKNDTKLENDLGDAWYEEHKAEIFAKAN
jgi:hypothetical protein